MTEDMVGSTQEIIGPEIRLAVARAALGDLTQQEIRDLRRHSKSKFYAVVMEILGVAGMMDISPVKSESEPEDERFVEFEDRNELLGKLKRRFEVSMHMHESIRWSDVQKSLEASPEKLWSLQAMEEAGHEPNVYMEDDNAYYFGTCSVESPEGARNIVLNAEAEASLPEGTCSGNAIDLAKAMRTELMTCSQYEHLQSLGLFDVVTWSWIRDPDSGDPIHGRYLNKRHPAYIGHGEASDCNKNGALRVSLRVPKA